MNTSTCQWFANQGVYFGHHLGHEYKKVTQYEVDLMESQILWMHRADGLAAINFDSPAPYGIPDDQMGQGGEVSIYTDDGRGGALRSKFQVLMDQDQVKRALRAGYFRSMVQEMLDERPKLIREPQTDSMADDWESMAPPSPPPLLDSPPPRGSVPPPLGSTFPPLDDWWGSMASLGSTPPSSPGSPPPLGPPRTGQLSTELLAQFAALDLKEAGYDHTVVDMEAFMTEQREALSGAGETTPDRPTRPASTRAPRKRTQTPLSRTRTPRGSRRILPF